MKIVVVLWKFEAAGAERVAISLARGFAALGHEVRLLTSIEAPQITALEADGISISISRAPGHLPLFLLIQDTVKIWVPDVVLSHQTPQNVSSGIALLTTFGVRRPIYFCVEHGEPQQSSRRKGIGRFLHYHAAKFVYPAADGVICISVNVANAVRKFIKPFSTKISVLPNAVVEDISPVGDGLSSAHPWLSDGSRTIVGMGRLVEQKNFSLLIRAMASKHMPSDVRLVIFGEGEQRNQLVECAHEAAVSDRVDLAGVTSEPLVELSSAAALVLSSHWEGLPTVAIEALSVGTRIVSTDNSSGIRELLAEKANGLIVDSDPDALAIGVRNVLGKEDYAVQVDILKKIYGIKNVARRYIELFEASLSGVGKVS